MYKIKKPKQWAPYYYTIIQGKLYLSSFRGNKIVFTTNSESCIKYKTLSEADKILLKMKETINTQLEIIKVEKETFI